MAEAHLDAVIPNRRSLDVGVDNAYRLLGEWRPFAIDEIITLLKADEPVTDELYKQWSDASLKRYYKL